MLHRGMEKSSREFTGRKQLENVFELLLRRKINSGFFTVQVGLKVWLVKYRTMELGVF